MKELETIKSLRLLKDYIINKSKSQIDLDVKTLYLNLSDVCEELISDKFSIGLAKYYIERHTEEYVENDIVCVKTSEYFNPYLVIDILNKNYENLESLIESFERQGENNEL